MRNVELRLHNVELCIIFWSNKKECIMSKKSIALSTMLLSVLLILISVGKVTMRGIAIGEIAIHQTFLVSEESFYKLIESGKSSFILSTFIFFVGCLLWLLPNFLLFNEKKQKSMILMAINTIGIILIFSFCQFYQYLFMMITTCLLLLCNTLIQFIDKYKNRLDMFIIIIAIFVFL